MSAAIALSISVLGIVIAVDALALVLAINKVIKQLERIATALERPVQAENTGRVLKSLRGTDE